jgi:hypothetical protein
MYTLKKQFVSLPLSRGSYREILFTDKNEVTKLLYWAILPFSFMADIILYIPRKTRYLYISNKNIKATYSYRKLV